MVIILCLAWIFYSFIHYGDKMNFHSYLTGSILVLVIVIELVNDMDFIMVNPSYNINDADFCGNINCVRMIEDYHLLKK